MMRSLYSAVSGLKTHQTRMDVIGNNIANVNTEAFKASSVRFSEIMYQTTSGASAGNGAAGTGGKNAKQTGLGVKSGATAVNITGAGSAETTGNPFDLRLNDKNATNFFVVSDGTNRLFTRAGDFYVDGNGYLCMSSTGYTLQGWQVDAKGTVIKDTVSSLQVMSSATKTSAPEATTKAYVSGVLDKNDAQAADTGRIITIGFFDDLGYNYTAKFGIKKTNTDGTYDVTLKDIVDSKGNSIFDVDKDGNFITSQGPNGQTMYSYKGRAVDPQTIFEDASLVFDQSEGTFTSISSANSPAAKTINLNLSVLNTQDASINGSNFSNIEVDFSKSMNYNNNGTSTIGGMNGDLQGDGKGKALGALTGITVSDDGKIYGSYDNGNTVLLCQIAVAQFANASGLEKIGDNCYQSTLNSGEFDGIGVEISADGGSISSGELEMSNVDLSSQFTDISGSMMFLMKLPAAHFLVNKLMGRPQDYNEPFDEMDLSAMKEIGNIIAGAYLSALSTMTNLKILPSIPYIAVDMAASILSVPAIQFGQYGDNALFIETEFGDDIMMNGYFILMPDLDSYDNILSALGISF